MGRTKHAAPSKRPNYKGIIRNTLKKELTPFMLISRQALITQYQLFRKHLPEITPYYAIKAHPHPKIIEVFKKLGSHFDVASGTEMKHLLKLGIPPHKLIFAHTIKQEKDIIQARRSGVDLMTYDNETELEKITKHFPKARVLLRIKVSNLGSNIELSLKFGADYDQAIPLLVKARTLGLQPVGLSFHVGSQCATSDSYLQAIEIASAVFEDAAEQHGMHLQILDIGGGFPIKHRKNENIVPFKTMARKIRQELKRFILPHIRCIAEPGRFFVGPAGTLVTQVIGKSFRNEKDYYYLNDGVYGDFSGVVFDNCKYQFHTLKNGPKSLCTLGGPTCDSFDTISISEELPKLTLGDIVYVHNIGAYSHATAVQGFNGFQPAKVIMAP